MEPFATLHIEVQGGKFDVPTRLLWSIEKCFFGITHNMDDYRELIPEFFFQPEFLMNLNDFDLGTIGDNSIADVELPSWAKSPIHFIYLHRKALESKTVSETLNHWIDLVFGYQQRGEAAFNALNVYRAELYDDIIEKRPGIESTIETIGQIPPQLFREPHPHRIVQERRKIFANQYSTQLPTNEYLFGHAVVQSKHSMTLFAISNEVIRVDFTMNKSIETSIRPLSGRRKLPEDLRDLVAISNNKFAGLCSNNLEAISITCDKEFDIEKVTRTREKITAISSNGGFLSISSADARNHLYKSQSEAFSIPTYRSSVVCSGLSKRFGVVVSGTSDSLVIGSTADGSTVRVIKLGFVPHKVMVTPTWGFILVNGCDYENGKAEWRLALYTINGLFVAKTAVRGKVDEWVGCVTTDGFDWVVMAAGGGKIFAFEVFWMDVGPPVYTGSSRFVGLNYLKKARAIVGLTEHGTVVVLPFVPTPGKIVM
jgi:hypothetical protein